MTTEDIKHLSDATARAMQVTWSEKQMVADSFLLSQRLIALLSFVLHFATFWACQRKQKTPNCNIFKYARILIWLVIN